MTTHESPEITVALDEVKADMKDLFRRFNDDDDKFVLYFLDKYGKLVYLRNNIEKRLLHIQYFITNEQGKAIMSDIIKFVDSFIKKGITDDTDGKVEKQS